MLIPAKTTPMMLVQVYKDIPISGARILAATISRMSPQALAVNTIRYGRIIDSVLIRRAPIPVSLPAGGRRLGFIAESEATGEAIQQSHWRSLAQPRLEDGRTRLDSIRRFSDMEQRGLRKFYFLSRVMAVVDSNH